MIRLSVPIQMPNPLNAREHWGAKARRAKSHRLAVYAAAKLAGVLEDIRLVPLPATVTITKVGPRRLDDDGATASAKHVRDEIAQLLGIDDGDPEVTWVVKQESRGSGVYGCEIEIQGREGPLA